MHTLMLLAVFGLLMLPTSAQESRLSYHLKPGEKYVLDIDIQQNTRSDAMNSADINLSSRAEIEFQVDSLEKQGLIYFTVGYKKLLLSMLAPGLNIELNSGNGKNTMLSNMVDSLTHGTFHIVMDATGELRSLEGLDAHFESLASYQTMDTMEHQVILKTLEEVYGTNSFKSQINLFVTVYPVLESMTNWTNDIIYYFNTKPVNMVNRYTLAKSTPEEITIQGIGMLNAIKEFREQTNMGEVRSAVSGSQTYDFQMELETGWLKRCVSRQRVLIETTIIKSSYLPSGLKIPSFTETVFEVKGSRIKQ